MTGTSVEVGLCASCTHGLFRPTARGTSYWRCLRSKTDPSYPRYPRLPVFSCSGFEPRDEEGAEGGD